MYISGNQSDFVSRLHQLGTTTTDLNQFKIEASGFWTGIDLNQKEQLQKEAKLHLYQIYNDGNYLTSGYF